MKAYKFSKAQRRSIFSHLRAAREVDRNISPFIDYVEHLLTFMNGDWHEKRGKQVAKKLKEIHELSNRLKDILSDYPEKNNLIDYEDDSSINYKENSAFNYEALFRIEHTPTPLDDTRIDKTYFTSLSDQLALIAKFANEALINHPYNSHVKGKSGRPTDVKSAIIAQNIVFRFHVNFGRLPVITEKNPDFLALTEICHAFGRFKSDQQKLFKKAIRLRKAALGRDGQYKL